MLLLRKLKALRQDPLVIIVSLLFVVVLANDFFQRVYVKSFQPRVENETVNTIQTLGLSQELAIQVDRIKKEYQELWTEPQNILENNTPEKDPKDGTENKDWITANQTTLRLLAILSEKGHEYKTQPIAVIQVKDMSTGKLTTRSLKNNDVIDGFVIQIRETSKVILQSQENDSYLELVMYKNNAKK